MSAPIQLRRDGGWLHLTLDRPARRNAMSEAMVDAIEAVLAAIEAGRAWSPGGDAAPIDCAGARALVLRGAGGHFCAGGDIADMQRAATSPPGPDGRDPIAAMNRRFGEMLEAADRCSAAVIAVCEGAVMGGGFGLACVADVTVAVEGARFRLPETSLGITPAQIAPFIVQRLGLSQARRLAVTGETLGASEATALGLAHLCCAPDEVDATLGDLLAKIRRCEPGAVAATKGLVRRVGARELGPILDDAAAAFAAMARGPNAQAGMMAMLSRRPPPWAE